MKEVYRLLDWLDSSQAVEWLQDLTKTKITYDWLLKLCDSKQCSVYLNVEGLEGDDMTNLEKTRARGIHKVLNPVSSLRSDWFENVIWTEGDVDGAEGVLWEGTLPPMIGSYLFKPSDIQALADKMNGIEERENDAEELRRQLIQERAAREAAESGMLELRRQRGTEALTGIEGMVYGNIEYRSLLERAEKAEQMVESMDKQLREKAETIKMNGERFNRMEAPLEDAPKADRPDSDTTAGGLTFPYATKHLEAMRDAASHFWKEHDRTTPAPYGIQKKVQNFLAGRTGENTRKLAELAAAIKPDNLPKT